jgi:unsaturated rhamnogalacturonyl hydrolase
MARLTRLLLIAGLLLILPRSALAAGAVVQSKCSALTTGTISLAFASSNVVGNTIILGVRNTATASVSTVADTAVNTYTPIGSDKTGTTLADGQLSMYRAFNIHAGANTVTVTFSAAVTGQLCMAEASGLTTTDPYDVSHFAHSSGGGASLDSGATSTTTQANEYIVGMATSVGGNVATWTAGTNYTLQVSAERPAYEDRNVTSTGTYNSTFTISPPRAWVSGVATFKVGQGTVPVAPYIASLSPTSGPIGTLVTIAGTNFGTVQGTVNLNGTPSPATNWSPSSITVAVPTGANSGNVVVTAGGLPSNGVTFTVLPLTLPSRAQVLAAIENVNNFWIPNNNTILIPGETPGNSDWDQATYFSGDLAAYDATGQANYLSFAQSWASKNNYSLIGGNTTTNADAQAAGQAYIRLYQLSNTSSDLSGITQSINGMVNGTVDNEWTWVDAINMSMPDFAELGSIYNNTNYYTKMYALYSYAKYTLGLYDSTTGLWWRDSSYVNTSTYWSRGDGWAFAAHAKVLSVLPKSDPHYAEYLSTFTTMAQALAARQQPGGYWDSGLGATDYPGPESSGTSLFLYGLAWGLNNGILDQNTYLPVVEKTWNFLANTAIQPSGLLGYVQASPPCNCPGPTSATTTYDYGVGAFLLAARQMALLTQ